MTIQLAYVAGPYRSPLGAHGVQKNIEVARAVAAELWEFGHVAVCPHMNTAHFDGLVPDQRFLDGSLELMRRCDLVVLTPRWRLSRGTREEIVEALMLSIPIFEWPNLEQPLGREFFNLEPPESAWPWISAARASR